MELVSIIITRKYFFFIFYKNEKLIQIYLYRAGHGLSLGASKTNVPAFPSVNLGTNYDLIGKANLWRDKSTSLDLTGTATRTQGGINHGANNFGAALGLTHWFNG